MKEQHPRGLIAKNKHSKALMTPYRNPSKFDSVHNFRNQSQIQKDCMEADPNGTSISETICPTNYASFWQVDLSDVFLSKYPNISHNFKKLIFTTSSLQNYINLYIHLCLMVNLYQEKNGEGISLVQDRGLVILLVRGPSHFVACE